MKVASGGKSIDVRLEGEEAVLDGRRVSFRVHRREGVLEAIEIENRIWRVRAHREGQRVLVWCAGRVFELERPATSSQRDPGGGLVSPMPGRVRTLSVAVGDRITRGQVLLILEAMKMEHAIRAPRDGVITALACKQGDQVEAGVKLAEIA